MQIETIITVAVSIFGIGATYGTLNSRIKQLETKLGDWKNVEIKVTKMEVQLDFIVEKLRER